MASGERTAGSRRPAGRDHRTRRSKDDDQRAQLGSESLHGGPRGRALADVGECDRGTGKPHGRGAAHAVARLPGGKALRAQRANRDPRRSSARMAPRGVARFDRRHSDVGEPVRLRSVLLSQRAASSSLAGRGPYFYLPKTESHLEVRLWNDVFRFAQDALGIPQRNRSRDRADRNDLRRVRDGGDPVRAARSRGWSERGALGLPVQHHQGISHAPRLRAPRPLAAHDDRSVHARVHAAAHSHLPPSGSARDRRDGGVHSEPARSGGERARARQSSRGQGARVERRMSTGPGSRIRISCPSRRRSSIACSATGRIRRIACATTFASTRRSSSTSPFPTAP